MMAYTTYTAAVQFQDSRKPRELRPYKTRLAELSAPGLKRSDDRKRLVRRLVALPTAVK